MNTKDRQYLEALTNSIAKTNQNSIRAFEALQRAIEETNVKLGLLAEQIAKLNCDFKVGFHQAKGFPISTGIQDQKTIDYDAWVDEEDKLTDSGLAKEEESKKELHPMIENNKFVDDGSLFQDEEDATPNLTPSPRRRNGWESNLVSVTCAKCGKTEKINKLHATGSIHVCQRCARR